MRCYLTIISPLPSLKHRRAGRSCCRTVIKLMRRDGLALNLGPEDWQFTQARSAFHVLARSPYSYACCSPTSSTKSVRRPLRLFISMDMNVLPATTSEEAESLKNKVLALLRMEDGILQERDIVQQEAEGVAESREGDWNRDMGKLYLQWEGRKVLSTFSGHAAPMGGQGWEGWLSTLERELGEEVCRFPCCRPGSTRHKPARYGRPDTVLIADSGVV